MSLRPKYFLNPITRLVHKLFRVLPARFNSHQAGESELAAPGIFAQTFAHGSLVAGNIEQIVGDLKGQADASTIEVAFALPGGAYATAVMREVMKPTAVAVDDTPEPT